MILSIMLLLSSFPNVCGEKLKIHSRPRDAVSSANFSRLYSLWRALVSCHHSVTASGGANG